MAVLAGSASTSHASYADPDCVNDTALEEEVRCPQDPASVQKHQRVYGPQLITSVTDVYERCHYFLVDTLAAQTCDCIDLLRRYGVSLKLCACPVAVLQNMSHICGPLWVLSPIYTMKNRCNMQCDKHCDRGNPCCTLSQAVATAHRTSLAWLNSCDSLHCDMGRDMHCDWGNPGRKLGVGSSCIFSTGCTGLATR